jgi:hypothetical protein
MPGAILAYRPASGLPFWIAICGWVLIFVALCGLMFSVIDECRAKRKRKLCGQHPLAIADIKGEVKEIVDALADEQGRDSWSKEDYVLACWLYNLLALRSRKE